MKHLLIFNIFTLPFADRELLDIMPKGTQVVFGGNNHCVQGMFSEASAYYTCHRKNLRGPGGILKKYNLKETRTGLSSHFIYIEKNKFDPLCTHPKRGSHLGNNQLTMQSYTHHYLGVCITENNKNYFGGEWVGL